MKEAIAKLWRKLMTEAGRWLTTEAIAKSRRKPMREGKKQLRLAMTAALPVTMVAEQNKSVHSPN